MLLLLHYVTCVGSQGRGSPRPAWLMGSETRWRYRKLLLEFRSLAILLEDGPKPMGFFGGKVNANANANVNMNVHANVNRYHSRGTGLRVASYH